MNASGKLGLLLSCEHGGNELPREYRSLFASNGAQLALRSHRGFDPGALHLAQRLSQALATELHSSSISRLLIDLNRSIGTPDLFSKYTKMLSAAAKDELINEIYLPFRKSVSTSITKLLHRNDRVAHFSVHTFTPRYCGVSRKFDIGVLFDPSRSVEARLAGSIQRTLASRGLDVRSNEPYFGTDDGHTTELRTRFSQSQYVGIEIEVSNRFAKFVDRTKERWAKEIANAIVLTVS